MLAFIPNRILGYIALGCALLVPVGYGVGYWVGFNAGKASVELKTLKVTSKIREKQNEARNHRPDDDALIDILLNGRF